MSKNTKISITHLSPEIQKILNRNAATITDKVKHLTKDTTVELTQNTKRDAPVKTKEYKRHITNKKTKETSTNVVYTWYVKDPEYRLTHLISNGHRLVVGTGTHNRIPKEVGKTRSNEYLRKNVTVAENKFVKGIKEIIKNAN